MIQTLHQMYSLLPHPILASLIEFGLACAVVVAIWDAVQRRRLLKKLNYQSRNMYGTLLDTPSWDVTTVRIPVVKAPVKNTAPPSRKLIYVMLLGIGFFCGIGFGQQIVSGQDNSFRVCTNGACTTMYHETCSDWWQYL